MGADLHIHVLEPESVKELFPVFFGHTIGSKYFSWNASQEGWSDAFNVIGETPNIWIGAVSWLKANLYDDAKTFIPDTVSVVSDVIGEDLPMLDEELKTKILEAFDLENKTGYGLANKEIVEGFLNQHMGKKLFTVSW